MVSICELRLREIRLPLKEPFQISSGVTSTRRILLVELCDGDGLSGWAECCAAERPHYSPETIDTAWLALREWIAPLVLQQRFGAPGDVYQTLTPAFRGHRMAKAAVEMAAYELFARRGGISLAEFLGGTRDQVATGISIGIQETPQRLADKVREAEQRGYRRIKVKIQPGSDVEFVGAAREALDAVTPLTADANSAYRMEDLRTLRKLDEFRLTMLEQPLAHDDLVRHAVLQRELATPICLDESITSLERAEDMVTLASGKFINIKSARVGGLTAALAIHNYAAEQGIPVWCGGMLESGIGRAHNVALASLANFEHPGDLSPSARYWDRDIVSPEWTMKDGMVTVPRHAPGMGVDVDRDRIEDTTTRTETLT